MKFKFFIYPKPNQSIMSIKISMIALSMLLLFSCDVRKSVSQDLTTGLSTNGDGLSCESVTLSDGDQKISRKAFTYGEKFYVNFEDIQGFKETDGKKFPGMKLSIVSEAGDTVLSNNDLYANNTDGFDISPLLLQSNITVANPIHSNANYTFYITIWDKKGDGTFNANMNFNVIPSEGIAIKNNGLSYDEVYLFSSERKTTIIDNTVKPNEDVYMIFEGLEGFKEEQGRLDVGLSIKAVDSNGDIILDEKDLIGDSGMEAAKLKDQLAPSVVFSSATIKNPVNCTFTIWDKRSEKRLEATAELQVE